MGKVWSDMGLEGSRRSIRTKFGERIVGVKSKRNDISTK